MLSHDCRDNSYTVTVAVKVGTVGTVVADPSPRPRETSHKLEQNQNPNPSNMAGETGLLECPMCDFTVLPTDDYVLQLHFEQLHTTDSPFKIEDDAESPPPALPPRPASSVEDTPSSDEEENTVMCPESDCAEVVPLIDFNDHLDFHAAETLSFDETTGKYHSRHSSAMMHGLATRYPHAGSTKSPHLEHNFVTDPPEALKKHGGHGHKRKKRGHRDRSNTSSSEKSTLSRSILTFNPFTKMDKTIKPPSKSARLGVGVACSLPRAAQANVTEIRTWPSCLGGSHAQLATRSTRRRS
jgi:hypothetical protein